MLFISNNWRVPDSGAGGTQFGSRMVKKLRLVTKRQKADDTFLSYYLGNRIKVVEVPLNVYETSTPFNITVQHPNPINSYIGRMLDPNLEPPPKKSFSELIKSLNKKPLAENVDMSPRLFQGVGVPKQLCESYTIARK